MIAILCQTFSLTKRFDGFVRPGRYIRNIEQEQMRLLKARILGFQSFGDSGDIEFLDGINLIVGQNNAGKSAFYALYSLVWQMTGIGTPTVGKNSSCPNRMFA